MSKDKVTEVPDGEDLPTMIRDEFERLGFKPHTRDVTLLSDALELQAGELGEIGVMAACVGYMVGKGMRFE